MSIEQETTLEQESQNLILTPDSDLQENKEQRQQETMNEIKNREQVSKQKEQMTDLKEAVSKIQKQIELSGHMDDDARKER